jgi:hypothetical protein
MPCRRLPREDWGSCSAYSTFDVTVVAEASATVKMTGVRPSRIAF